MYKVRFWQENFENNRTRQIECCTHVWVPNKQHGMGFTFILSQPDGASILGIWYLIVEACSLQKLPREGYLTDSGMPNGRQWNVTTLTLRWRRKPEEIQRCLDILSSQDVQWLEFIDSDVTMTSVGRQSGVSAVRPIQIQIQEQIQEQKLHTDAEPPLREEAFNTFYQAYPKKKARKDALKAWNQAKDKPDIAGIIKAIEDQKQSKDWLKDGGQFIPYPASWLRAGRWTDEIKPLNTSRI